MMKKGFTLAEVLITLGVIGVVAAITIPTLMKNHEKQVQITQLKKFYSVFQTGLKSYMANEGSTDLRDSGLFNNDENNATWVTNMNKAIKENFKIIKDCPPSTGNCSKSVQWLDGWTQINQFNLGYSFVTSDNFLFMIRDSNAGNCALWSGTTTSSKLKNACAEIFVDINGSQQPNTWGRDNFYFLLATDGTLYPYSSAEHTKAADNTENYKVSSTYWRAEPTRCGTAGSTSLMGVSGTGCTARVIEEGWQMNY